MKKNKILSLIAALTLTAGTGFTPVLAKVDAANKGSDDSAVYEKTANDSDSITFNFNKIYTASASSDVALSVYPKEALHFTVTADSSNPGYTVDKATGTVTATGKMIEVTDVTTVDANPDAVTMTIPADYGSVGTWKYTVTEIDPNDSDNDYVPTQGVTYSENGMEVVVTVSHPLKENSSTEYDMDNLVKTVYFENTGEDGQTVKTDYIKNIYSVNTNSSGAFNVKKTVSGNMADADQKFDINVTLSSDNPVLSDISYGADGTISAYNSTSETGWKLVSAQGTEGEEGYVPAHYEVTVTVSISANDTAATAFKNVPVGVEFNVEENSRHILPKDHTVSEYANDPSKGYTVTYKLNDTDEDKVSSSVTDVTSSKAVIVNNQKGDTPKTGIFTNSTPYIAMVSIVAVIAVAFIIRKRRVEE